MNKKFLSILVALSLILNSSAFVFANSNSSYNQEQQDIEIIFEDGNNGQVETSFFSDNYDFNKSITSKTKNGKFTPTYRYMKAFFDNQSDGDVTVYIQDGNGSTLKNGSFSASKGGNRRSELMTVDNPGIEYKFNISSDGGGTIIKGKLIIKTATTSDGLK